MPHNRSITRQCAGRDVVALIPAAGNGTRIAPIPASKEVFPIGFANVEGDKPEVKVVSQYLFERLLVCVPSTRSPTTIRRSSSTSRSRGPSTACRSGSRPGKSPRKAFAKGRRPG